MARKHGNNPTETGKTICLGPVMPIGGAEDKDGPELILRTFITLAGESSARVAVIPTASEDPARGDRYVALFRDLGAAHAEVLRIERREDTNDDAALRPLLEATGIFITGGSQGRLVEYLVGTRVMECVRERNAAGVTVAGTSAGASILPAHVMAGGDGEAAPRKGMGEVVAGFGLLRDMIIDQHFSERGRMGRLMAVFAGSPGLLALGLDEDTAALIRADGILEVVGNNSLTIVDGRSTRSDFFHREPGELLTITQSALHVLAPGRRFDLNVRALVPDEDLPA